MSLPYLLFKTFIRIEVFQKLKTETKKLTCVYYFIIRMYIKMYRSWNQCSFEYGTLGQGTFECKIKRLLLMESDTGGKAAPRHERLFQLFHYFPIRFDSKSFKLTIRLELVMFVSKF